MNTDIRKKLRAIVEGLDGVTPGEWTVELRSEDPDDLCYLNGPYQDYKYTLFGAKDAAHIARCDRDTMREIGELVEKQDAKIAQHGEVLWPDAINEIALLEAECCAKNAQIERLTDAIVGAIECGHAGFHEEAFKLLSTALTTEDE